MAQHDEFEEDHGHSLAAWIAVAVILVGAAVMALAVAFPHMVWFIVGAVIAVVGAILGKVLSMAGFGASTVEGGDSPDSTKPELGTH